MRPGIEILKFFFQFRFKFYDKYEIMIVVKQIFKLDQNVY